MLIESQDLLVIFHGRLLQSSIGEGTTEETFQDRVGLGLGHGNTETFLPLAQQIQAGVFWQVEVGIGGKGALSEAIIVMKHRAPTRAYSEEGGVLPFQAAV